MGMGRFACPLAHAAFSAAQPRSYRQLAEKENESLPIDIGLDTLAFAVTCYGIVHGLESLNLDATSELKNKTFDTLRNHLSFYIFNHRGPSTVPAFGYNKFFKSRCIVL